MFNKISNIFSNMFGQIENKFSNKVSLNETSFNEKYFNNTFKTLYYGSTDGFFMNNFIDEIIQSNEKNPNHIIIVNYEGIETSDASELRNMKKQFTNGTIYEIMYEYDENGLINKAKIGEGQMSEYKKNSFNNTFKNLYYGSTDGFFMNNFIDKVIQSNEENPNHIIIVSYEGIETSDASELRSMKKQFTNGTTYEIMYEYDESGLINKAKIEK